MISELIIRSLTLNDGGTYKCMASNQYGNTEMTIHISIQGKKIIITIPKKVDFLKIQEINFFTSQNKLC